jgi:hypothetical protein
MHTQSLTWDKTAPPELVRDLAAALARVHPGFPGTLVRGYALGRNPMEIDDSTSAEDLQRVSMISVCANESSLVDGLVVAALNKIGDHAPSIHIHRQDDPTGAVASAVVRFRKR